MPPFCSIAASVRLKILILLWLAVLVETPLLCAQATTPAKRKSGSAASWSIRWQPANLVNGSPILFLVHAPQRLKSLSGKWLEHEVFFAFDPRNNSWYAFAGASLETRPGSYPLVLEGTTAKDDRVDFRQSVSIRHARYPTISVRVPEKFTAPNPQQMEQIKRDRVVKEEIFSRTTPGQEWSGRFVPPVTARISDRFGTRRLFNGAVQSMHQGLDYAVSSGTPVAALNRGTVVLARPLFFEGNCVMLDHGQGLMTMYLHLSEIAVKEGEQVARGQRIGRSGGTGRATGPHLHVAVRWEGVYLNPTMLFKLPLP